MIVFLFWNLFYYRSYKSYRTSKTYTNCMNQFEFTTSEEKKTYVRKMFSDISRRYDFLNHFLSFGLDYYWRRKAVKIVKANIAAIESPNILDIACGTGDLSFEILKQIPNAQITGIDLAEPMLEIFRKKA